jgi:hypothetical protein
MKEDGTTKMVSALRHDTHPGILVMCKMGRQVGETSQELVKSVHNVPASVLPVHEMK